jgi:protease-4
MSNTGKWVLGIGAAVFGLAILFFGIVVLSIGGGLFSGVDGDTEESSGSGSDRVAIVDIDDEITVSDDIIRELRRYESRSSVKAIVLRLDSPGGAVAPSQEIFQEVRRIVKRGMPVVVSMSSVAASGAFYIACGASRIVANPGSITGSIGVISEFTSYRRLMDKIGVDNTTITSGAYKDVGNPSRFMTEDEYRYMQGLIDDIYEQFVADVSTARALPIDTVRKYADGRVFTGRQACAAGLVDTLGSLETAVRIAAKLAKISGEPRTVRTVPRETLFERLFGARTQQTLETMQGAGRRAPLQYRIPF